MNWGKSIILTYILFAGFIGTMVTMMSRQRVDLVRDDYYQDEIAYQTHMSRVSNAKRLGADHPESALIMNYQPDQQQVSFVLPDSLRKAVITFYRPSDRQQDFRVSINEKHTVRQVVSTANLTKGYWRVQFAWSDGQRDYYRESDLFVE